MPTTSAQTASGRLLSLLSLLQARRDWPGTLLAERLEISARTVRRDIDRLRELGYPIAAIKGPDGGYRLEAGTELPPLLFDDEQAVALAVALRIAITTGAGIEEAAARALGTVRQVMPARLRHRIDSLQVTALPRSGSEPQVDTEVLLAVGAAIRAREVLRFDYTRPGEVETDPQPPRRVEPVDLLTRGGRWYLLAWDLDRGDWRTFRADRITPRTPTGPRFTPREVPGGDVVAFVAARFRGSSESATWPCQGEVILRLPATEVAPFAGEGTVEALGPRRCRVQMGAWSWAGLAASVGCLDADIEAVDPPELRSAFAELARRFSAAAECPELKKRSPPRPPLERRPRAPHVRWCGATVERQSRFIAPELNGRAHQWPPSAAPSGGPGPPGREGSADPPPQPGAGRDGCAATMTPVTGHETDDGPAQHDEGRGEPVWQPVSRVGPWTLMVLEQLAHSRAMWATLEQARPTRAGAAVLDDATVSRTREVYGQMASDYRELYAAQARRWQAQDGLDERARADVDAFAANVDEHLVVLDAILALIDEVAPYTIEAVLGRSDLELGLEALLGHRPGRGER